MSQETKPIHLCGLGPSGIGKSPLAALFRIPGFEPYRVREPRDEKDRLVCKSPAEAKDIFIAQGFPADEWPTGKARDDWFCVGSEWLFFSARGDKQCLQFQDEHAHLLRNAKRIEIFAPRLVEILGNKDGSGDKLAITSDNLAVILLNPSAAPFTQMKGKPDIELEQATFYAITKRTELQGKPVDLPDALKRIRRLPEELVAWVQIQKQARASLECTAWQHSEFRYFQPGGNKQDAVRELLTARDRLLREMQAAASANPTFASLLRSDVIRSAEEVLKITDIV